MQSRMAYVNFDDERGAKLSAALIFVGTYELDILLVDPKLGGDGFSDVILPSFLSAVRFVFLVVEIEIHVYLHRFRLGGHNRRSGGGESRSTGTRLSEVIPSLYASGASYFLSFAVIVGFWCDDTVFIEVGCPGAISVATHKLRREQVATPTAAPLYVSLARAAA